MAIAKVKNFLHLFLNKEAPKLRQSIFYGLWRVFPAILMLFLIFISPFEKRDVLCYRIVQAGWRMQDGFRSISREIFNISSTNLVHISTRARRRSSLNLVTLTSFSMWQRSFKATACERWFLLNIWRNIGRILTKFGTQKHQGKTNSKFELVDLDLIFKVTGHLREDIWKIVSAQYLKRYLMYPHQIWCTEAPVQD